MARREQYEVMIKCPNCGHEGRMEAEENENPLFGRDIEIQKVTGQFEIRNGNAVCVKCNCIVA